MYAFGFNKQMDLKKRQHISLKLLEAIESSGWKRLLGAFNLENND